MTPGSGQVADLIGAPITVVRGNPTDAELAAVVAVLTARASAAAAPGQRQAGPGPARSVWARRDLLMRRPLRPGPTAWREIMT